MLSPSGGRREGGGRRSVGDGVIGLFRLAMPSPRAKAARDRAAQESRATLVRGRHVAQKDGIVVPACAKPDVRGDGRRAVHARRALDADALARQHDAAF